MTLGKSATFHVGDTFRIEATGAFLHLVAIDKDTRCGTDEDCNYAGDYTIHFTIKQADTQDIFVTGANERVDNPATDARHTFRLHLQDIEPAKQDMSIPIPQNQYRITVAVTQL